LRATEANHRLALGELDAAFYYDAVPTVAGVALRRLGLLTNGIYCGRGHPLFAVRRPTRALLLEHAFSVPATGDRNTPMDSWPVEIERRVGFRIELLVTNIEICRSGRFLTVLPDVVGATLVARREIRRFAEDLVPPVEVYAATRASDDNPAIAMLVTAVEAHLKAQLKPKSAKGRVPSGRARSARARRRPRETQSG
jgi:DNA-binding transcriptional LysR family regulator